MDEKSSKHFRICPLCGQEIFAAAGRCYFCEDARRKKEGDSPQSNTMLFAVIIFFVLILLLGFMIMGSMNKIQENQSVNATETK